MSIAPSVIAAATQAAVATAAARPDAENRWADAVQATIRALLHRLIAARGLSLDTPDLPYASVPAASAALDAVGSLEGWAVLDVGEVHQELLRLELADRGGRLTAARPRDASAHDRQGSWYTPQPLALATTRLALEAAIDGCLEADDPEQILRLRAIDPACGAGAFLLEGARLITGAYACRLAGAPEPPLLVRRLLPEVTYRCVFGMDIDPVAVDLARTALWLEVGGRPLFDWLDDNVACVDPLSGPDALPERLRNVLDERAGAAA
jgi:hypothetical protein